MRWLLPCFVAVLVTSCWRPWPESGAPSAPGLTDDAAFALVVRGDTIVLDEYIRTPDRLDGLVRPQVQGAKFGWARYRLEFGSDGQPERAEVRIGRVGTSPDSPDAAVWSVVIRDGELTESWPHRPPVQKRVPAGTVPVFAPSMGMNHELIRQAILRGDRRGPVAVAVYPMATGAGVATVTVSWSAPDTVLFAYSPGPGARVTVDRYGRALGSRTSDNEHVTVRVR